MAFPTSLTQQLHYMYGPEGLEIKEEHDDLIYQIVKCPNWTPIASSSGIYERVLENFKTHKSDENLIDHEEYQWVRVPSSSNIYSVFLVRPGKIPERASSNKMIGGRREYVSYWTNVVRLDLFFYYSATHENVQAFTFGDRQRIIKPLKILNHKWELPPSGINEWNGAVPMITGQTHWKCSKCGMTATSKLNNGKAILPDQMLTCDEAVVQDILV